MQTEKYGDSTLRTKRRESSQSEFGDHSHSEPLHPYDLPVVAPYHQIAHFSIQREIGRGGFGVVYLAFDQKLDRHVALKIAFPDQMLDSEEKNRFKREAQAAASLVHPGIVPVYEIGQQDELHYYVMPYYDCQNLMGWFKRQTQPLEERVASQILLDIARAIQFGHDNGIVHGDIKPQNILMPPDSTKPLGYHPIVLDFGLCRFVDSQEATTSNVMGTPMYMAPEHATFFSHRVTVKSDVYSLGVILYQLLTGHLPHQAMSMAQAIASLSTAPIEPLEKWRPNLSKSLEAICLKCLRKDPDRRYSSASEFAEDLERFLNGVPVKARPLGMMERLDFVIRFRGIRQSLGRAIMVMNTVNAIWTLIGTLVLRVLLAENPYIVTGFWPALRFLLTAGLLMHAVGFYLGWVMQSTSRRYLLLLFGALASLVWDIQMWQIIVTQEGPETILGPSFMSFYTGSPMARVLVFLLIAMGFAAQTLFFLVGAWAAYRDASYHERERLQGLNDEQ